MSERTKAGLQVLAMAAGVVVFCGSVLLLLRQLG
jgi:hypothetical protein